MNVLNRSVFCILINISSFNITLAQFKCEFLLIFGTMHDVGHCCQVRLEAQNEQNLLWKNNFQLKLEINDCSLAQVHISDRNSLMENSVQNIFFSEITQSMC